MAYGLFASADTVMPCHRNDSPHGSVLGSSVLDCADVAGGDLLRLIPASLVSDQATGRMPVRGVSSAWMRLEPHHTYHDPRRIIRGIKYSRRREHGGGVGPRVVGLGIPAGCAFPIPEPHCGGRSTILNPRLLFMNQVKLL